MRPILVRPLSVALAILLVAVGCSGTFSAHVAPASPSPSASIAIATATPIVPVVASASPTVTRAPSPDPTPVPPTSTPKPTPTPQPLSSAVTPRPPRDPAPVLNVQRVLDGGRARFGRNDVRVRGWLAAAWGIGGLRTGVTPSWLGEMPTGPVLWQKPRNPDGCFDDDDCVWIFSHVQPGSGVTLGKRERWVTLTGHFDDPAARTCAWDGQTNSRIIRATAVRMCRDAFVVTSVRNAPAP
jgi:hypothetical protein